MIGVRFFGPAVAAMVAFLVLHWLVRGRGATLALDKPNPRSLHDYPVPRTGGVGIVIGFLAGAAFSGAIDPALVIATVLAFVSFLDDIWGLPVAWRMATHLLAASVLVAMVKVPWMGLYPILALGVAWMANLYNFMDGSDGLAGGMAVLGFGTYAAGALSAGETNLALASLCVAAAAAAFLVRNFPPARVFMGDVGSIPLGFLAGALGIEGWQGDIWPIWFPVIAFAPFIVDATATLFRRTLRGEIVWQPHREHYYQRLILMGWSHWKMALAEYAFMAASGACALIALRLTQPERMTIFALLAGAFVVAMWSVDARWRRAGSGHWRR